MPTKDFDVDCSVTHHKITYSLWEQFDCADLEEFKKERSAVKPQRGQKMQDSVKKASGSKLSIAQYGRLIFLEVRHHSSFPHAILTCTSKTLEQLRVTIRLPATPQMVL